MDLFFHFPQLPFTLLSQEKKGILHSSSEVTVPQVSSILENYSHFPYSSIYLKKSQNVFKEFFVKSDTYKYPITIRKQKVTQNPTTWNHYH